MDDGLTTDNLYLPRDGRIVYLFVMGKWQGAVLLDPELQMHGFSTTLDLSLICPLTRKLSWGHVASLLAFTPDMKNDDAEEASR